MDFRNSVEAFTDVPLNRLVILDVLKNYKRPNDKISELIKNGDLLQLKKGLYVPGVNLDVASPELFVIANHLQDIFIHQRFKLFMLTDNIYFRA